MMRTVWRAGPAPGTAAGEGEEAGRGEADLFAPGLMSFKLVRASHCGNKRFQFLDQFFVKAEIDLLLAVAPGLRRVWVDLDEQAVGVERGRRLAHLEDHVGPAAA